MSGVRNKKEKAGYYRGWYKDRYGIRKSFKGTSNKAETREAAKLKEIKERKIFLGLIDEKEIAKEKETAKIIDILNIYLEHGDRQGGRNGKPWSPTHSRNVKARLNWWISSLKIKTIIELNFCNKKVEELYINIQKTRSNKTAADYLSCLKSFTRYLVKKKYLVNLPFQEIEYCNKSPETKRRAFTREEINKIFKVADSYKVLLYKTAMYTGLRANELRSLKTSDLDTKNKGLTLSQEWTKNRKDGFIPLPNDMIEALLEFSRSGDALTLYRIKSPKKAKYKFKVPKNPLLYVPKDPVTMLNSDMKKALVEKTNDNGTLVFHSFRMTYSNLLSNIATPKEHMDLMRHSKPELTFNVYTNTTTRRLREINNQIFTSTHNIGTVQTQLKCANSVLNETHDELVSLPKSLLLKVLSNSEKVMLRAGFEPDSSLFKIITSIHNYIAKSQQISDLEGAEHILKQSCSST